MTVSMGPSNGALATIKFHSIRIRTRQLEVLSRLTAQAVSKIRAKAIILDLGDVQVLDSEALTTIAELKSTFPNVEFSAACVSPNIKRKGPNVPLNRILPVFRNVAAAFLSPDLRRLTLSNMHAVVLATGWQSSIKKDFPDPLLDFKGKPMLAEMLARLAQVGVGRVTVVGANHFDRLRNCSRASKKPGQFVSCFDLGASLGLERAGLLETLSTVEQRYCAFEEDAFLIEEGATSFEFLAEMASFHASSEATFTSAYFEDPSSKNSPFGQEKMKRPKTGVHLLSPEAKAIWTLPHSQLEKDELESEAIKQLIDHAKFIARRSQPQMLEPRAYFELCLSQVDRELLQEVQIGEASFVYKSGCQVPPGIRARGRIHIGPDCQIEPEAELHGPCIIGAGSIIPKRTVIKSSILQPDTKVKDGAWISDMILSNDWCVPLSGAESPTNFGLVNDLAVQTTRIKPHLVKQSA